MVQGENGLHYKAEFDITDFKRKGEEMLRMFRRIETEGSGLNINQASANVAAAQGRMTRAMRDAMVETERLRQENLALQNQYQRGAITLNELTAAQRRNTIARQEEVRAMRGARQAQVAAMGSYREAQERLKQLGLQIRNVAGGFAATGPIQQARIREYNELNQRLQAFDRTLGVHNRNIGNYSSALAGLRGMASTYLSAFAVLGAAGRVVDNNAEISDSLADVQRTAQLTAKEAEALLDTFKKFDTRTSLKGLVDIATIGGQMGVAKDDIAGFTKSIDQLAVVLSGEIPGGAEEVASALGKINGVFKVQEREGTSIEEAYNRTGSAILGLGQAGLATGAFLQDFTLRVGGAAVAANISLPTILAYGSVLEEAGSTAEVAGTSLNRLIGTLSTKRDKFFAIAQLGDATLDINKFTKLINTDANAALQLFFKGLNTGNPTLTQFSDRLDTIGVKAGPSKNAIIALAQNQEKLSEKVKMSTADYLDAGKVVDQFALKNDNLAGALAKLWNNIANAFTSSNLSGKIAELINSMVNGKSDVENMTTAFMRNKESVERNEAEMSPLLKRYDELTERAKVSGGAIRLNKKDQNELREVTAQIGALMPSVITQFDNYGSALDINRSKVDQMTKAQRDLLAAQNASTIDRANTTFDNATSEQKKMQQAIIDGGKSGKSNSVLESGRQAALLLSGLAYQSAKSIRDLGGTLTKQQQEVIDHYEKITPVVKAKTEEIIKTNADGAEESGARTVDAIKAQISALVALQKPLDINSAKYKEYAANIKKLRAELKAALGTNNSSDNGAVKRAEALSNKIADLHNAAVRKQKSSDQEELDSIKDKYNKMRDEINAFYADADNAGRKVKVNGKTFTRNEALGFVAQDENLETIEATAKRDASRMKDSIEAQKVVFDEFEAYKREAGLTEANRRFAAELKGFKSYVDYLKGMLPDPSDQTSYANKMRDLIEKDLKPKAEKEDKKRQEDEYTELLKSTATYQQIATSMEETYQQRRAELVKKGDMENLAELDRLHKVEMDGLIDQAYAKTDLAKRLSEEVMVLTRKQIKDQIKLLTDGYAGQEIPKAVQDLIDNLNGRLSIGADQGNLEALDEREADLIARIGNESTKAIPELTALKKELQEIQKAKRAIDSNGDGLANRGLGKFLADLGDGNKLKGVATGLGFASDAAFTLSEGLGGVNTEAGYTLDTIGQLAGAASDLGAAILSNDPAKIIGSAIKAFGTLFSIGRKVREMNLAARKEVEDFYAQAISGEREYQDLLKQRQLQNIRDHKTNLQGIRDEIALRKSQAAAYSKEALEIMGKLNGESYITSETYKHGTWFRKAKVDKTYGSLQGMGFEQLSQMLAQGKLEGNAKALVERLKELEQKGYDAEQAMADLAQQTSELFTGTSANTLTDTLADMFRSGKTSAQDFADFFKQSMDDAALSIFKNKVLADAMEDFYKKFDAAAQSGDELTAAEIAQLEKDFNAMTTESLRRFQEFQKITGSNLAGPNGTSGSTMNDRISSITSTQADKLEGVFRGVQQSSIKTVAELVKSNEQMGKIYQLGNAQLSELTKQTANTREIADNTKAIADLKASLASIDKKMDKGSNSLNGTGRTGG